VPQIGATIEEMQTLQAKFAAEAETVTTLRATIQSQIDGTWWVGPAAERFKGDWAGNFSPMLQQLSAALTELSTEVQRRAAAIEQAGG
jgi:uncharacterized protein YukE